MFQFFSAILHLTRVKPQQPNDFCKTTSRFPTIVADAASKANQEDVTANPKHATGSAFWFLAGEALGELLRSQPQSDTKNKSHDLRIFKAHECVITVPFPSLGRVEAVWFSLSDRFDLNMFPFSLWLCVFPTCQVRVFCVTKEQPCATPPDPQTIESRVSQSGHARASTLQSGPARYEVGTSETKPDRMPGRMSFGHAKRTSKCKAYVRKTCQSARKDCRRFSSWTSQDLWPKGGRRKLGK